MKRAGSSPPSPVLLLPPMRFIAIASVSCASLLIEPNDIAPVAKRFMMDSTGSTSFDRNRIVGEFEFQQAAQRAELLAGGVHQRAVFLEDPVVVRARGVLQLVDRVGVVHVVLPVLRH